MARKPQTLQQNVQEESIDAPTPSAKSPAQTPQTASRNGQELKDQRLVDGSCMTCTGLTYFTRAMKESCQPARCYGFSTLRRLPPLPFTLLEEIDEEAKRRDKSALQRHPEGSIMAYEITAGVTCVTSKMEIEGISPLKISGIALAAYGGERTPRVLTPEQKRQAQARAPSAHNSTAEPSSSGGDNVLPPPRDASAIFNRATGTVNTDVVKTTFLDLWTTRIVPVATWTYDFWKPEHIDTYPERFINFQKKYFAAMGEQVYKSAIFGRKMVEFWLPKES